MVRAEKNLTDCLGDSDKIYVTVQRIEPKNNLAIVSFFDKKGEEYSAEMDLSYLRNAGVDVAHRGRFEMGVKSPSSKEVYVVPIPEKVLTKKEIAAIEKEIDKLWKDLGGKL